MAIDVTRAAVRLAPGAVNRSGERGVCGFRTSLTQQCEEGDPEGGKPQSPFYRLRSQRREVRPGASALLDGENLDLLVAHPDEIACGSADWSPRPRAGAPESARNARRLHFSKPVSVFNGQRTPAPANFRSNCRTRACSNFNCLVVRLGHSGGL